MWLMVEVSEVLFQKAGGGPQAKFQGDKELRKELWCAPGEMVVMSDREEAGPRGRELGRGQ